MQFKVRAGRFIFDKESKKVKVSKQKGLIHIIRNQQQQTHFKWANLDANVEQLDIIVFGGDAVFQAVIDKKNTYVLRFEMDEERYFFWLQDKTDGDVVVKEINRLINFVEEEEEKSEMVDEAAKVRQQPEPTFKSLKPEQPSGNPHQDLIARLTQGLASASKKQNITAITHLSEVITPEGLGTILKQLGPEERAGLLEFMPPEHADASYIPSTLRSPQFQQALDVLSDALNSENALPLFMEMGLNQDYLKSHYGVEAFLLALIDKARKK